MARNDGREVNDLREIKFTRGWLDHAEGSVLVEFGKTRVSMCCIFFSRSSTLVKGFWKWMGHF